MLKIYDAYFDQLFWWSRKTTLNGEPSFLTTCLIVSTLQIFNAATIIYLFEATADQQIHLSKLSVIVISAVLLLANIIYFNSRGKGKYLPSFVLTPNNKSINYGVVAYVVLSVVLLIISVVLLLRSSMP